ncbi:hypothetical protein RM780_26100 [Streptomyces sp. DSM 44917]|uniref:Uncharacterized protein n=1 Tax=Streptomyces boetiae TaxID=3075541 RepID=A0ABU2LFM9_9ACTN|nr:hypothetical protein [Streptomyces sp. DSM 44917]MDT0310394.1 hypothetical protein [Streptomyces sp. DSM 44917]
MRSPYQRPGASATPIYDSLCAEYRRLFRALPGDRSGEEELRFVGFSTSYGIGAGAWRERRDYALHRQHPGHPTASGYAAAYAAVPPAPQLTLPVLPPGPRPADPHGH